MFNTNNYFNSIEEWNSKFKSLLNQNKNGSMPFYILNKLFLELNEKRGQLNKNLLKENNAIDPEAKFYILNGNLWSKINNEYPSEKELKVKGTLNNKKCVLEFDKCLYYFYFLNTNQNILEEGYMKFDNQENAQIIKAKFFELEINDFFQKMKIKRQMDEMQKIFYQNQNQIITFLFKLKQDKDKKINNFTYIMIKNINNTRSNRFNQACNNNNKNINNYQKMIPNNINIVNKNNNYSNNPCKIKNCNTSPILDKESINNSLKIYKCIYYYYEFKQNFKKINESKKQILYLIDKKWLQNFKNNCKYKSIKDKLKQENPKIKGCNDIIKELAEKYPLKPNIFHNKPKSPEIKFHDNSFYYYESYDFIDEKTQDIFVKEFSQFNINIIFTPLEVIPLKNKIYIVFYEELKFEIYKKNERFLFLINNKKLDINLFINSINSNYNDFFKILGIQNKNIFRQNIGDNNFGEMINLLKIPMKRNNSVNKFNKSIAAEKLNSNQIIEKKEQRKEIISYDNHKKHFHENKKIVNFYNNYQSKTNANNNSINFNNQFNNNLGMSISKEKIKIQMNNNNNCNSINMNKVNLDNNNNSNKVNSKNNEEIANKFNNKDNMFKKITQNKSNDKKKQQINNRYNNSILDNNFNNNNELDPLNITSEKINEYIENQKNSNKNNINSNNKSNNNNNKNNIINNNNNNNIKNINNISNNNNISAEYSRLNNFNSVSNNFNNRNIVSLEISELNNNNRNINDNINASSLSKDSIFLLYLSLKCLENINYLTMSLLNEENIKRINSDKNKYKLARAYVEVIKNLNENKNFNSYLQNFISIILQKNPSLFEKNESTPKNLILYIIEVIHIELNIRKNNTQFSQTQTPSQYNYQSTFNYYSHYFNESNNSVISNLFYGSYNLMMQCPQCKSISHNIKFYNNLSFSLDEVYSFKKKNDNIVDIIECFEFFQKFESIGCQICNFCHHILNNNSRKIIITIPNVLIINLERKRMQSFIKLKLDEYLNLSNFIYNNNNNQCPINYELIGIISSYETQNENKYYFSFCKSFNNKKWYKYNKNGAQDSSFQEASNEGSPYTLIYSKEKI